MEKEWIKDKFYYRKKYNTEKQNHEYTKEVMIESQKVLIEQNADLKLEVDYLKEKIKQKNERLRQKIERIKELENKKRR